MSFDDASFGANVLMLDSRGAHADVISFDDASFGANVLILHARAGHADVVSFPHGVR